MKIFVICLLLSCTFSLTESAAATDCDVCTTNYDDTADCAKIKTYMSCLVDTYETDNTLTGCSDVKTKMDTAKTDYGTADCATSAAATGSCLCEVAYYQSTTLDCPAVKTKLTCLFAVADVGCDGSKTNRDLITAAKVVGDAIADCLTDTCKCEAIYQASDLSSDTLKCTAVKAELLCLFPASGLGCDGSTTNIAAVTAVKGVGKAISDCITDTCECEAIYNEADVSTDPTKCTAVKAELTCLFAASAAGCDSSTTNIATVGTVKTLGKTITDCITDTCECEAIYNEADVSIDTNKCTAVKAELTCLFAASAVGCAGSTNIATVGTVKTFGKTITDCISDTTCECQAAYYESDIAAAADKCTKLKEEMHCLVKSDGVGCDGTSTRSAVAIATDALILDSVDNCRTALTTTCTCAIDYAKANATVQCTAATAAQTCMKEITATTEKACDGVTLTATYLSDTITPLVTKACGGSATILLSVSVVAGYLLVLFEMFH